MGLADGLARKWDGMLQHLAVLARLGNPGCKQRLKLAARNLDTRWVNGLLSVLGKKRGQSEEPPLG
eukprot:13799713-Alexandrium_andersonii.AAC.1